MKTITLEAWISFGDNDSNDWCVFADVTEEEYALLENLREELDVVSYYDVDKASPDLAQKLIDIVREDAEEGLNEEAEENPDEQEDNDYSCFFYYKRQ